VTQCSVVDRYQHFGGTCCLNFEPSVLKMEALGSSETLVSTYKTTNPPNSYSGGVHFDFWQAHQLS
jgi:hypothetical protein